MKKVIATISILSLIAGFAFGCTPANTTKNNINRNVTRNNTIGNETYDGALENPSTYDGYTRSGINNSLTNLDNGNGTGGGINGINALGDTSKINSIKNVCNRKENVEDTSVVINDDTCYVGLDVENGNLSETMKEDLSKQIKRVDPNITKVYFTEDRNVIDDFANSVKDTVNVDWSKLQNMFR